MPAKGGCGPRRRARGARLRDALQGPRAEGDGVPGRIRAAHRAAASDPGPCALARLPGSRGSGLRPGEKFVSSRRGSCSTRAASPSGTPAAARRSSSSLRSIRISTRCGSDSDAECRTAGFSRPDVVRYDFLVGKPGLRVAGFSLIFTHKSEGSMRRRWRALTRRGSFALKGETRSAGLCPASAVVGPLSKQGEALRSALHVRRSLHQSLTRDLWVKIRLKPAMPGPAASSPTASRCRGSDPRSRARCRRSPGSRSAHSGDRTRAPCRGARGVGRDAPGA